MTADNPTSKYEAAHCRFVILSPTRGVFLGEKSWTKDVGQVNTSRDLFQTYTRPEGQEVLDGVDDVPDATLRVVYPSRDTRATAADLNNAGINL